MFSFSNNGILDEKQECRRAINYERGAAASLQAAESWKDGGTSLRPF